MNYRNIIQQRLEFINGELQIRPNMWSDIVELQILSEHIEPGDNELLEAGVMPEVTENE